MLSQEKLKFVKRKTRQRLIFTVLTLGLYFSYVLSYTSAGEFLSGTLGDTNISGSLALYAGLIVVFIIIEVLFLYINTDKKGDGDQG